MKKYLSQREFFEYLYDRYEQRIYYQAYSILQQNEQAEDVTQEVFEQLYLSNKNLQELDDNHLTKFIMKITKNKAIDTYRKNSNKIKYLDNYQKSERDNNENNNVDEYVDNLISEEEFLEISNALKPPYLQVFIYRIYYGLSTNDVAKITCSKESTVRKQFERAKKMVKEVLGGLDND